MAKSSKLTGETVTLEELEKKLENAFGFLDFCNGGLSKGSPVIKEQTLKLTSISKSAMYLAYVDTFANSSEYGVYKYTSSSGANVFAVEEHHTGQYCILRDNGHFLDLACPEDPKAVGLPAIAILAVASWLQCIKGCDTGYQKMSFSACDITWLGTPDDWKLTGSNIYDTLLAITDSFKKAILSQKDYKVQMRKITLVEEMKLPPQCDASKFFSKSSSIEDYETASEEVEEKLYGKKKVPSLKDTLMALPKLMERNQMIEEQQYLLHDYDETEFKGFVFADWHFHCLLGIGKKANEDKRCFRNLLLYGPAGTGKSTARLLISLAYDLPDWGSIVCSSEMSKGNFIGEYAVSTDDTAIESQRLVWKPSCLLKCLRYGGVVEIQEPSCIRDPGVLTVLNDILSPTGWIEVFETGERFQRHPNCVIILTTNQDYAGCRDLNMSVVSRMDMTYFVPGLTEKEMISRAKQHGITLNDTLLNQMAHAFGKVIEAADQDGIHGDCSFRTFLDWCKYTSILGSALDAAEITVIHKIAFSSEFEDKAKLRQVIHSIIQKETNSAKLDDCFVQLRQQVKTK